MITLLTTALLLASNPAPLDGAPQTRLDADLRCQLGVYGLSDGRSIVITGANGSRRTLQYTLASSQFAALQEKPDQTFTDQKLSIRFSPCNKRSLTLSQAGQTIEGSRLNLVEKETHFLSDGITLHGKLVLPLDRQAKSLAVWIEGSNNDPSTDDAIWPYELAHRGIAMFVYDKRGTGASGGSLSSNFEVRAKDTVAAIHAAQSLMPKLQRVGVIGGSQGGWVAPLVAKQTKLDFMIGAFAMAEGPIAQDQAIVLAQLEAAGVDPAAKAKAKQLMQITEKIVRSNMQDTSALKALADLDAFKAQHQHASWLNAIQPRSYTGLLLTLTSEQIKVHGPAMAQGMRFDYDPLPVIRSIAPRQLWLLGGKDRQAPNANTQSILKKLQQQGRKISLVVLANADHGLIETDTDQPRYAEKIFDITASWIDR
jgi:uncharacterized protein